MDLRIFNDRTMAVVGPSQAGKTIFTLKLLNHRDELFKGPTNRVVWCYGIYQKNLMDELGKKGYIVREGIIPVSDIQPSDIIVLDELLQESRNSQDVTSMFTRAAHHKPCFIIFLMQTLFPSGKDARTRSLNTHYYVIFKNPRDKGQVEFMARQIHPRNPKALVTVFEDATQKPHSYLFLDLTQECPEHLRYRTGLFEKPLMIYQLQNTLSKSTFVPHMEQGNPKSHTPQRLPRKKSERSYLRRCKVCSLNGKRKETVFACLECPSQPALCIDSCFFKFHELLK